MRRLFGSKLAAVVLFVHYGLQLLLQRVLGTGVLRLEALRNVYLKNYSTSRYPIDSSQWRLASSDWGSNIYYSLVDCISQIHNR